MKILLYFLSNEPRILLAYRVHFHAFFLANSSESLLFGSPAVGESPDDARRRTQSCNSLPSNMISSTMQPTGVVNSPIGSTTVVNNSLTPSGLPSSALPSGNVVSGSLATSSLPRNSNSKSNSPSTSSLAQQTSQRRSSKKDHVSSPGGLILT